MMQSKLGDYLLLKRLGSGSMGETFLAEHSFLKQLFVLKVLPKELSLDEDFIHRFEKEVQFLSTLDHPHIAKMHNASFADNTYFLLTEYVPQGIDLGSYFAERHYQLKEEEVLKIARQIASALDCAHEEKGVTHGALKMSNIIVQSQGDGLEVLVTDFGLTRIVGPLASLSRIYYSTALSLEGHLGFTEETYLPGNPDAIKCAELHRSFYQSFLFLAPEQKAHVRFNSPKADVYAFGVLLYYLLTGEFPEGYFELPSKKIPNLRWNWDLLICRMLQTDPGKRPESLTLRLEELLGSGGAIHGFKPLSVFAEETVMASSIGKPILKPRELKRPSFDADPGAIFQKESVLTSYKPMQAVEQEIEPVETQMQIIPAGTYFRGSNHGGKDEMPRHEIHLNSFAIDMHPVTNEQFLLFLEAMGGEKDVNNNDMIRLKDSRIKRSAGRLMIESGYARHPVVGVSWYGAVAYAKWVGKRLPSEAEWEIAACGGREETLYPSGNSIERSDANFFSSDTTVVMSYEPNGYGLYDMAGNVYEWCQDWYDYHFYDLSLQEPDNPKGPLQGVYRVLKGGCWKSSREDLRCAHRHRNNPGVMNGTYGFRCAADVLPS